MTSLRASFVLFVFLSLVSPAYALDLTADGLVFDIDEDGTGAIGDGHTDAYDTAYSLRVGGTVYNAGSVAPQISPDGRHLTLAPVMIGNLLVQRHVYVPASGGTYARYVDVIVNPGAADETVTIEVFGNLGSDSSTRIVGSSSGDTALSTADVWFATDDATDGGGDTSTAHVMAFAGGTPPSTTTLASSDDDFAWTFDVTIPAGGRVALLSFAVQANNNAAAMAEAQRIAALPSDVTVGLGSLRCGLTNARVGGAPCAVLAAPGTVDEGAEIVVRADVSDLEGDPVTWSWDLDGDGVFGEMPNAPTYTVPAGTTDGDDELSFAVEASDGTNVEVARHTIIIVNVPPTIVSEPPLEATGGVYRYQVVVEEPGGANDPVTFRLGGSLPPGMTITDTGLIEWIPPPQARGRSYRVVVRTLDDDLAQDLQEWELSVSTNVMPASPTPVSPLDLVRLPEGEPVTLVAENASDPDGDVLAYFFELSPTSSFSGEGLLGSGEVDAGETTTSWTTPAPLPRGVWYWRVWSSDGRADSLPRHGSFVVGEMSVVEEPDAGREPDAGITDDPDAGAIGGPSGGGCSAVPSATGGGIALALLALGLIALRRRGLIGLLTLAAVGCNNAPPLIPEVDAGPIEIVDAGMPDAGNEQCTNGVRDGDESHVDCGGQCGPCPDGSNCVFPADCESGVCSRGYCLARSCNDGVRNGPEIGVDCGGDCDLCADGVTCSSNAQCMSGHCRSSVCVPAECDDGRNNGLETDLDCGGGVCLACATGAGCRTDRDCSTLRCLDGLCEAASCGDRIQNQDETSIDCGGASCAPCRDGLACEFHLDCASRHCFMGGCVSCTDGLRNADETDVDCGGARCGGCADGRTCALASDCVHGNCTDGTCISCEDMIQNAAETDVDCGGPVCNGCDNGAMCNVDSDCLSNACADGRCVGVADTCARPAILTAGTNRVPWIATANDYLPVRPACSTADVDGPDIVMSYTATVDGLLRYEIAKPTSQRWVVVVSSGACGELTPEVQCFSDSTPATLSGEFPVTPGTTYWFYLADTTSGTMPLTNPLSVTITEIVPLCRPGVDGVNGGVLTRRPTGITSITESYVVPDASPTGYVYIGGTTQLFRVPKAGGTAVNVLTAAPLQTTDLGYALVVAGNEIFTIDDSTTSTSNRVVRISSDGGATWIANGESYATFTSTPGDDFRGAVVDGSTMYLITQETTSTEATEIWSLPVGAATLPVTPTRLGTIPFLDCTGLAVDATYFYTMCEDADEIVRVHRTTLTATAIPSGAALSTTRNEIAVDDLDGDGTADAFYFQTGSEEVAYGCGFDTAMPLISTLSSWGTGTLNYGLGFDASTNTIYSYDDDTHELIVIQ